MPLQSLEEFCSSFADHSVIVRDNEISDSCSPYLLGKSVGPAHEVVPQSSEITATDAFGNGFGRHIDPRDRYGHLRDSTAQSVEIFVRHKCDGDDE
ncbi:MAG: hypothetical protein ACRDJL_10385 [Actinomycetota bacterium]